MSATPRPVYLIAEDHALAKPLIDHFALTRTRELEPYTAFAGGELLLAESRGDPAVVAALVGFLLGSQGFDERTRLVHIGQCFPRVPLTPPAPSTPDAPDDDAVPAAGPGATPPGPVRSAPVRPGQVVLVNRVVEPLRGRGLLPDILLAHEFPEVAVETLGPDAGRWGPEAATPGTGSSVGSLSPGSARRPAYIDRELSGFLGAGQTLLAPHQLYCLAAVVPAPGDSDAADAVRRALNPISRLIAASGELLRPLTARATDAELRALAGEVAAALRLTASQAAQLRAATEAAAARGARPADTLARWRTGSQQQSKQERSRRFDELKHELEG